MATEPTILVVEDERDLADLYVTWVDEDYETRVAYDAATALQRVGNDVDVVLLDRKLPDGTGDDVLAEIRARGHDYWVIMVTAVDPGLDIVELDIDEYVTKPVSRTQLIRLIETLRVQSRYREDRREVQAISNKMDTLEDETSLAALEDTEQYQQLETELQELGESLSGDVEK